MSNYIRAQCPGGTFFFTIVTYDRRSFLTTPAARQILRRAWLNVQGKWPFHVDAVCLLPDHFHCVITLPENDANYALRWRAIKGTFSRQYRKTVNLESIPQSESRHRRGNVPVWQHRYWEHMIRDDTDSQHHIDYIHYNPVKHRHVIKAIDYPWSTFHQYLSKGVYDENWGVCDDTIATMIDIGE